MKVQLITSAGISSTTLHSGNSRWEPVLSGFSACYPGSMHGARILRNSTLYQRAEQGDILPGPVVDVDGHKIGPYLLGDSAYLLSPWLQMPFLEATRDRSEIRFNRELSSVWVKKE